jgi:hypothetical protein
MSIMTGKVRVNCYLQHSTNKSFWAIEDYHTRTHIGGGAFFNSAANSQQQWLESTLLRLFIEQVFKVLLLLFLPLHVGRRVGDSTLLPLDTA